MACTVEFMEFVCTQLAEAGDVRSRKMFGDYMIYVNEKPPVVLACDNIAYVKIHPAIAELMTDAEKGFPYEGAKEHYILDIEHKREALKVVRALEQALPYPKPKKKKKGSRGGSYAALAEHCKQAYIRSFSRPLPAP